MAVFHYEAKNRAGESVEGVLEADDESAVLRQLDDSELFPVDVRPTRSRTPVNDGSRVRRRDLGVFYGQLADLLDSGVPLLRALDSIIRATVARHLVALLREIRDEIADGKSLTRSMSERPETFPLLHVAMVQAGERASFLEQVLHSLSGFVERLDELRAKVRGALIYPALLCVVGSVIMTAALVLFVPKFEPLLRDAQKPLPTVLIFGMSVAVREYWFVLIVAVVALIAGLTAVSRSPIGRRVFETWRLRVPVVGTALRMVAISRFCRILGTMLHNDVPLLQALSISKDATGSTLLASHIDDAIESVRGGETLATPLEKGGLFPPQVIAMIAVAEESNRLHRVLVDIAEKVERRTHRQVDQAVRLLEPAILCVVAAGIGFLALGLLLPIFTLAGSLGAGM